MLIVMDSPYIVCLPPSVYSGKAYPSTTVGLVKSTYLIFMWNSWLKASGIKRAGLSKEKAGKCRRVQE